MPYYSLLLLKKKINHFNTVIICKNLISKSELIRNNSHWPSTVRPAYKSDALVRILFYRSDKRKTRSNRIVIFFFYHLRVYIVFGKFQWRKCGERMRKHEQPPTSTKRMSHCYKTPSRGHRKLFRLIIHIRTYRPTRIMLDTIYFDRVTIFPHCLYYLQYYSWPVTVIITLLMYAEWNYDSEQIFIRI